MKPWLVLVPGWFAQQSRPPSALGSHLVVDCDLCGMHDRQDGVHVDVLRAHELEDADAWLHSRHPAGEGGDIVVGGGLVQVTELKADEGHLGKLTREGEVSIPDGGVVIPDPGRPVSVAAPRRSEGLVNRGPHVEVQEFLLEAASLVVLGGHCADNCHSRASLQLGRRRCGVVRTEPHPRRLEDVAGPPVAPKHGGIEIPAESGGLEVERRDLAAKLPAAHGVKVFAPHGSVGRVGAGHVARGVSESANTVVEVEHTVVRGRIARVVRVRFSCGRSKSRPLGGRLMRCQLHELLQLGGGKGDGMMCQLTILPGLFELEVLHGRDPLQRRVALGLKAQDDLVDEGLRWGQVRGRAPSPIGEARDERAPESVLDSGDEARQVGFIHVILDVDDEWQVPLGKRVRDHFHDVLHQELAAGERLGQMVDDWVKGSLLCRVAIQLHAAAAFPNQLRVHVHAHLPSEGSELRSLEVRVVGRVDEVVRKRVAQVLLGIDDGLFFGIEGRDLGVEEHGEKVVERQVTVPL
mmetsp:Transcript_13113/g.38540  ORF Transcript_13113/g.38540 Transcript_13113/m.38540 type:complete len:521 (-) Transcript_13113:257-1819(-)